MSIKTTHRGAVLRFTLSFASTFVVSVLASVLAVVLGVVLAVALASVPVLLCSSCEHQPQDPLPPQCIVDGYCDYENGENMINCYVDCDSICTLTSMSGTVHEFLISELYLPDSSTTAHENGVDMNGDGYLDNQLGSILAMFASQFPDLDANAFVNAEIQEGRLLLVVRLLVDQFENDNAILVQLLRAVVAHDATPLFDGNDQVALAPDSPHDLFLCGRLKNGILEAGPGNLSLAVPLLGPGLGPLDLLFMRTQVIGPAGPHGLKNVMVGGGLTRDEIETRFYPWLLEWMQTELTTDATGPLAAAILDAYDGQCHPSTAPTCDPTPLGCASDGEIHPDELSCNPTLSAFFAPSLDIDFDRVKDLVPIGVKIVSAVPVTVVESP
ncbi:MAG: hypothetical protein RBU30_10295 [Polyangia bacterium]|jgi:hypothetical protein|nr:hypothetical protein [Polyangia bacterium]